MISNIVQAIATGGLYALIALGFSLAYRFLGLLNFAQPQFVMIGAMVGLTCSRWGLSVVESLIPGAVAGALAGVVMNTVSFTGTRQQSQRTGSGIIASLGWSSVLLGLALVIWGPNPYVYSNINSSVFGHTWRILGASMSAGYVVITITVIIVAILFQVFMRFTDLGLAMRAVADDRLASDLVGINVAVVQASALAIAGFLGGVAGVLLGAVFQASPSVSSIALRAFAPAVIGGLGDVNGAVFGGLLFGFIDIFGSRYFGGGKSDLFAYTLVILILLVRPQGIFGVRQRLA